MHDEPVGDVVQAGAAVLFRKVRTEQAELRHTGHELLGELAGDIGGADDGYEVFIYPIADGVANGSLLFREKPINVVEINAGELRGHASLG